MAQKTQRTRALPAALRTALDLVLMAVLSVGLLFGAQCLTSSYVVEDPVQTELLYATVYLSRNECVTWHPRTVVERQTARAIVDYLAQCRAQPGFRRMEKVTANAPRMELHFRTEDTYRVVWLGTWEPGGQEIGWTGDQDGSGLAKRIPDSARMIDEILEQLGDSLPLPAAG